MSSDQIGDFYEIGPGKVLCGLNKRINRDFSSSSVGNVSEVESILNG